MDDLQNLLALASIPNVGTIRLQALIRAFGSPASVFNARVSDLIRVEGINDKIAREITKNEHQKEAEKHIEKIKQSQIKVVTIWDEEYPLHLKQIHLAPAILYYCGTITPGDNNAVAIIGTRRPTEYGISVTTALGRELALIGITVISGLAVGIDSAAHRGALQENGRTLAVLGSGLDKLYPRENRTLARTITKQGAVITEFPLGVGPDPTHFPQRNRIISGLSLGVVIVEAGEKSGALITADFALEQGREIFVVPGNITSKKHIGSHQLIKQGAKLIQSVDDILEEIQPHLNNIIPRSAPAKYQPQIALAPEEQKVMNVLSGEPLHIDKISSSCGLPVHKVLALLLTLELKGVVKTVEGKRYIINDIRSL